MRFRLKFLIGALEERTEQLDPSDDPEESTGHEDVAVDPSEQAEIQETLGGYISRISQLASRLAGVVEASQGLLSSMAPDDRSAALDLIEEQATTSDEFVELVSEILDEIRLRFARVREGRFDKTTSGWPRTWYIDCASDDAEGRAQFLRAVRSFFPESRIRHGAHCSRRLSTACGSLARSPPSGRTTHLDWF